jgi:hypothetical protein
LSFLFCWAFQVVGAALLCISECASVFQAICDKKLNKGSYYTKKNLYLSKSHPGQSIRPSRPSNLHSFTILNVALLPSNNLIIRIHRVTVLQQCLQSDNQKETTTFIYSMKTPRLLKCFSTNNRGHLGIESTRLEFAPCRLESNSDHTLKPELSADHVDRVHSDFENFKVLAKPSNNPSSPPTLLRGCILLVGTIELVGSDCQRPAKNVQNSRLSINLHSCCSSMIFSTRHDAHPLYKPV